jgi:hypothetical protein
MDVSDIFFILAMIMFGIGIVLLIKQHHDDK